MSRPQYFRCLRRWVGICTSAATMRHNGFLTGLGLTAALFGCGGVSGIPIEKTATDFAKAICPEGV